MTGNLANENGKQLWTDSTSKPRATQANETSNSDWRDESTWEREPDRAKERKRKVTKKDRSKRSVVAEVGKTCPTLESQTGVYKASSPGEYVFQPLEELHQRIHFYWDYWTDKLSIKSFYLLLEYLHAYSMEKMYVQYDIAQKKRNILDREFAIFFPRWSNTSWAFKSYLIIMPICICVNVLLKQRYLDWTWYGLVTGTAFREKRVMRPAPSVW